MSGRKKPTARPFPLGLTDVQDAIARIGDTRRALQAVVQIAIGGASTKRSQWMGELERENLIELLALIDRSLRHQIAAANLAVDEVRAA